MPPQHPEPGRSLKHPTKSQKSGGNTLIARVPFCGIVPFSATCQSAESAPDGLTKEGPAHAAWHPDGHGPLLDYSKRLLLSCERKSLEPMSAWLQPDRVQATGQSVHELVAQAPE